MTAPDFDEIIDRTGTYCSKWDDMEQHYGVSPDDGLPMWVADMDFRPPASVQRALEKLTAHGVYGYAGTNQPYLDAIRWWMKTRHDWEVDPDWIMTVHGLVNGTGIVLDTFTKPGDAVALMTPVYHAFARVIRAAGREVTELPLANRAGEYHLDLGAWNAALTGREKILMLCSPHNPGGRVWTLRELREIADFATRHDLLVVADEIHHDLVMPGNSHTVFAKAAPGLTDRLITMTAATKTFNIAGALTGNLIVQDAKLRAALRAKLGALGISAQKFGLTMVTAAYSPEGAAWVDALMTYLDANRRAFDLGVNEIPGLRSMPLQATYLAWVDFSDTGMKMEEITRRLRLDAKIAANLGETFGQGGEHFLRFNLATPRARIDEAVRRLQAAFADRG